MLDTESVDAAETTLELQMYAGRNEMQTRNLCCLYYGSSATLPQH